MRFRFNVMVNGFVLVSFAVQSATAVALAHADILNTQGEKIDEADIASTDQGVKVALKVLNLSPREHGIHIQTASKCENPALTLVAATLVQPLPTPAPTILANLVCTWETSQVWSLGTMTLAF